MYELAFQTRAKQVTEKQTSAEPFVPNTHFFVIMWVRKLLGEGHGTSSFGLKVCTSNNASVTAQ